MKKKIEKGTELIHKVVCQHCGWYNNPLKMYKMNGSKYYTCLKCGREIKSDKDEFIDKLRSLLGRSI